MAGLLSRGKVATRLPAQDLARARAFYSEKLGLEPAEERPGGLLYRINETWSSLATFRNGRIVRIQGFTTRDGALLAAGS